MLVFGQSYAQEYAVDLISADLKKEAYAVVRKDFNTIDFLDFNRVKYSSETAITILNESGLRYSMNPLYYNNSTKINKFEAALFDAHGKLIRKLKRSDLKDVSGQDGFSLFIDTRIQYYDFTPTSYPFTIHYYTELTTSTTINLPTWQPVSSYNVGVENSNYTLVNHTSIPIRKKEYGFDFFKIKKEEFGNTLTYSASNIPPVLDEVMSPTLSELTPRVNFSPNEFQLEGVKGKMENWDDFGKWYYQNLIKNKLDLSESEKQTVKNLVDGIDNPVDKVRILYEYMQSKTRYVNISIGIGGWEPFPASYVSSKSYGDCKALSNYMVSLLEAVGIDAFHTIVYAESERKVPMKDDFTSLQGNHMIVNVPLENETLWLECTNQQTAFNYLGQFTDDRFALSITPEGGKIVSTKSYPASSNKELVKANGEILSNGNLKIEYEIFASGLQYGRYYQLNFLGKQQQDQALRRLFGTLPNLNIKEHSFNNNSAKAEFITNVKLESENYARKVGDNLILNLISFEGMDTRMKKDDHRKFPFEIRFGHTDETEFELKIPKGYKLNEEFITRNYSDVFGNYSLSVKQKDAQTLRIERKLVVNDGNYSKEKFNDYVEFRRKISSMDNSKILLEKN